MRIPTLLVMLVLSIVSISVIGFIIYHTQRLHQEKPIYSPENIIVSNISDDSITVTWETKVTTTGKILFNTKNSISQNMFKLFGDNIKHQSDERVTHNEFIVNENFNTHFVVLKDLLPETKYYFKIQSGGYLFPDKPLEFKTAKTLDKNRISNKETIVSKLVGKNLEPITDALVYLNIKGASILSSNTSSKGSFILPTSNLLTGDLDDYYKIESTTEAVLAISDGVNKSTIELNLPLHTETLPPIILGQDINYKYLPEESENKQ